MEEIEKQVEKVIPEITITDDKVVLPTKDIPLMFNGEEVKITLQKLPAGDRRDLANKHMNTKIIGQQVSGNIDSSGFQIGLVCKIIKTAPFPTDEKTIASFPDNVIDYIYSEYNIWVGDSKKNKD